MTDFQFAGDFETHFTVALHDAADAPPLRAWGDRHGLKFTHIVLARGAAASQPMLTRHARGVLPAERAAAAEVVRGLHADGFEVRRVKIEASPWNADVPAGDADARRQPADRHFEHHVKLLLPAGADVARLSALAAPHAGHVSRNALRVHDGEGEGDVGRQERFVTQRCYRVGLAAARGRFDALLAALRGGGYEVLEAEQEYVVYDSNAGLDAGWIDGEKGGPP